MPAKHRHSSTPCRSKLKTLRSQWRLARLFGLLPLLTACQTTTPSGVTDTASFCAAARAIYYSKHDTKLTIEQIREHNAVGVALSCGWKGAKQKCSRRMRSDFWRLSTTTSSP